MEHPKYKIALIVGAGEGLSASLARLLAAQGVRVALAARKIEKLGALCSETGAKAYACNATEPDEVERLFGVLTRLKGSGRSIVFISHFLDDILRISDTVTIFRNGRQIVKNQGACR